MSGSSALAFPTLGGPDLGQGVDDLGREKLG